MFEENPHIKTDVNKPENQQTGQPEGTLQQHLYAANPGDQELNRQPNAVNANPSTDDMTWAQIPHEEVRPELEKANSNQV